jgi:hypothetical protein
VPDARRHVASCGWFWAWVPIGSAGVVGLISLGYLTLAPAIAIGALILRSAAARGSVSGLLTGAGLPLLLVAFLNRDGPGTTCWHTGTSAGCDQHLNPLPWLLLGLALVVVGSLAFARRNSGP